MQSIQAYQMHSQYMLIMHLHKNRWCTVWTTQCIHTMMSKSGHLVNTPWVKTYQTVYFINNVCNYHREYNVWCLCDEYMSIKSNGLRIRQIACLMHIHSMTANAIICINILNAPIRSYYHHCLSECIHIHFILQW